MKRIPMHTSKGYVTNPNLKTVRVFNGKRYQLITETITTSKRQALKSAEKWRSGGKLVRIVSVSGGYALYLGGHL
jgi:hypothetical protein